MFQGKSWTLIYATVLSLACAAVLATLQGSLISRITLNRANEKRQIILGVFGIELGPGTSGREIAATYQQRIEERTATLPDGTELQYYVARKPDGSTDAIAVPIGGVGLWSYIHGYVSLEAPDFTTIRRVDFDEQAETPGLGGEIVTPWFRKQFEGKAIERDGEPIDHMVAKPGTAKAYQVDGVSGATITSTAVNDMLYRGFAHAQELAQTLHKQGDAPA